MLKIAVFVCSVLLLLAALWWFARDRDKTVRSMLPGQIGDVREGFVHADLAAQRLDPGAVLESVQLRCRYDGSDLYLGALSYTFYRRVPPRWRKSGEFYRCWHVELDNSSRVLVGGGPGVFGPDHTAELKRTSNGSWPGELDLRGVKVLSRQIPEILSDAKEDSLPPVAGAKEAVFTLHPGAEGKPQWSIHLRYPDESLRFTVVDAENGAVVRDVWDPLAQTEPVIPGHA